MTVGNGTDGYGIFHVVVSAADAIACTKTLVICKGRTDLRRNAGSGSEYGCERPSAQGSSNKAGLSLEERRLIDKEHVIDEFAVPSLSPILFFEIEGIEGSKYARGLRLRSQTQSLRPGEVVLQCQSAPIGHLEGNEAGVVVAVANAGVQKGSIGVRAGAAVIICGGAVGGNRSALQ